MKLYNIKTLVFCLAFCGLTDIASAEIVSHANEPNIASPQSVVDLQNRQNNEIDYMVENYSQPELAQFAVEMYKAEVRNAKLRGETPPPKPTREMLSDKQKIAEYLRSFYKYSY